VQKHVAPDCLLFAVDLGGVAGFFCSDLKEFLINGQ
jgi:hypothetical protein